MKPSKPKLGRPRDKFDPTPEQWDAIKEIWDNDKFRRPHKMAEIHIIMGRPIAFHLVRDRAKPSGVELDVDEPLVKEAK